MTAPHEKLNKGAAAGLDKATEHLPALTRAYGRSLRAAGRRAAAKFRQTEPVTAAANPKEPPGWVIPPTPSLIDQSELAADTEKKTGKLHRLILTAAGTEAATAVGISFDITAPSSRAILDSYATRIQETIQSAIAEQVTDAIQTGYAKGSSVAQVSSAIQQATDSISRPRADMLARSDLNGLSNAGSVLAATKSGAAQTKTWLTAGDEKVREWHADADGQTVGISETFDVDGEAMMYPGDPNGSWENTANCRCTVVYGRALTASGAVPSDFASWSDYRWEGDPGTPPDPFEEALTQAIMEPLGLDPTSQIAADAVTSGGTMSDAPEVIRLPQAEFDAFLRQNNLAATGDTGLPLSERDRAWDASGAKQRVAKWASSDGSGDKDKVDWAKYGKAFAWADANPSDFGAFHLPFADVVGGKLTAIFRGVSAAAGRLNQTDGANQAAVKSLLGAYYKKAKSQYSDPSIKAPWEGGKAAADGETLAAIRAHLADHGADVLEDDELRAIMLAVSFAAPTSEAIDSPDPLLAAAGDGTPWTATLCVANQPTVDSGTKRLLVQDGGSWRPLPLPLALLDDSPHADMTSKAPICGRIDSISWAGNVCQASGVFFDASDDPNVAMAGSKAAALVSEMGRMGISVDLVDCDVELCAWSDGMVTSLDEANDPTASQDEKYPDRNSPGGPATEANLPNDLPEMDEIMEDDPEYVMAFQSWVIAGATICPVQALTDATISLVASGEAALTAAAAGLAPLEPPIDWFEPPKLAGPTPLTVTDDGQVYGHMALWETCHTGRPGVCVTPPHSPSSYRHFHRGQVKTAEGERVDVGILTMNTGHAGLRAGAKGALAHYDDTGTQAAHVRAGEDEFGIWLAGAVNPTLSAEDARLLMASTPSGDWRELTRGEGLDMFGVLAVNVPGFPVPRTSSHLVAAGVDGWERDALVAAGIVEWTLDPVAVEREIAVLAASLDGIEGLARLVTA